MNIKLLMKNNNKTEGEKGRRLGFIGKETLSKMGGRRMVRGLKRVRRKRRNIRRRRKTGRRREKGGRRTGEGGGSAQDEEAMERGGEGEGSEVEERKGKRQLE